MRFSHMIACLTAASTLSLGFASASLAQTTQTPNTPPPPPSPCAGNACAQQLTVAAGAGFGGSVLGRFGIPDAQGNLVAGNGVTGTIELRKEGSGTTMVNLTYKGGACSLDCGSSQLDLQAKAQETGSTLVKAQSGIPGQTLGAINSGTLQSVATFAMQRSNNVTSPPTPAR